MSFMPVSAATLSNRSVTVSTSMPGAMSTHRFDFTIGTSSLVGSIEFEYCSNTPFVGTVCTAPAGFSASLAGLSNQTGGTGFVIDPVSTVNRIVISRIPSLLGNIPVSFTFDNVKNHDLPSSTVYVRMATYASSDGTGLITDSGAIALATVEPLSVSGFVPPYLTFCVGVTVTTNCETVSGFSLNFGELSIVRPSFLTSQFAVATNDPGGYSTSITGSTMTSGNNSIPGLLTQQASQPGVSQFGMNLRSNSNPVVGSDPLGGGVGIITPNYAISNKFFFGSPQVLTSAPMPSEMNYFTASYIINISPDQQPGIYTTTLTYIAVAAF